jgi:acyl-CoA thioester hydrolase
MGQDGEDNNVLVRVLCGINMSGRKNLSFFQTPPGAPNPLSVIVPRQVRYEEVDALGIVWHGHYASFLEDARATFGEHYGFNYLAMYEKKIIAPLVQMHIEYHLPLRLAEKFQISAELVWTESARIKADPVCRLMLPVLKQMGTLPSQTHVIWTGIKADTDYVESVYEERPRPQRYLPQHYRKWVCRFLGLPEHQGMEVNAACASSTYGLALAAEMIRQDSFDSILVCAADPISRFTFTGFAALRALSSTVCRPFDNVGPGPTRQI